MPSISINIEKKEFGVNAEDLFWCKQGILRKNQLRDGEDEQFLADIIVSILEDSPFAFSKENFDELYDPTSKRFKTINTEVNTVGSDSLKHDILATLSIISNTFGFENEGFSLRQLVHPDSGSNPIKTAFYAIFIAFYELCIIKEKTPMDNQKISNSLGGCHAKLNIAAGTIKSDSRRQNIDVIKGLIAPYFIERNPPASQSSIGITIRFENCLRRSKIETSAYECKQGLVSLGTKREMNSDLINRIIETACGISNIGPGVEGAIFIGVADDGKDAEKIKEMDSISPIPIASRQVVGIDREIKFVCRNLEDYKRMLVKSFSASGLSEPLKTYILSTMEIINYRNLSVVCIWIKGQGVVSTLNDELFIREGSNTINVKGTSKILAVNQLFS